MSEVVAEPGIVQLIMQTGFAGMIFVIWYVDQRKMDKLQRIVEEQMEDKKTIRENAQRYISEMQAQAKILMEMVKQNAVTDERTQELLRQATEALKRSASVLTKLEARL